MVLGKLAEEEEDFTYNIGNGACFRIFGGYYTSISFHQTFNHFFQNGLVKNQNSLFFGYDCDS